MKYFNQNLTKLLQWDAPVCGLFGFAMKGVTALNLFAQDLPGSFQATVTGFTTPCKASA
jgi:hypothetical protein